MYYDRVNFKFFVTFVQICKNIIFKKRFNINNDVSL